MAPEREFGAAFLRTPDLFPLRLAGEPWGERLDRIDFAGGPYIVAGLNEAQAEALADRFGPLLASVPAEAARAALDDQSAAQIGVYRAAAEEFLGVPDEPGWTYTFDREYFAESVRLVGLDWMGHLRFSRAEDATPVTTRGALFTPVDAGESFPCLFENFFRTLVAYRLLQRGGVLFHSAGIASDGVAHLFLGRSGAGKSTLSRLSRATGRTVLSDDMNAVAPDGGTFRVEKLPFAGELGRTPGTRERYPLGRLCRLHQGATAMTPLRGARAVAHLFACAPFVNADPHRVDALGEVLEALIARHPMVDLTVSLDEDCWPLLESEVASTSPSRSVPPKPWPSAAVDEVVALRESPP